MTIEQLSMFPSKDSFDSTSFVSECNKAMFIKIYEGVLDAWEAFSSHNIEDFDNTTKANMLNNLVVNRVSLYCSDERFVINTLTKTRRKFGLLDNKYLILFKKYPVSNLNTHQDELIKTQSLDKHVIFLVYNVDNFWNSIDKIEHHYYTSQDTLIYSYSISDLVSANNDVQENNSIESKPSVKIKKELQKEIAQ